MSGAQWGRALALASFTALAALILATELWLDPLRPGGSLLALKALPLLWALASLSRGQVRAYQWWSMLILAYLALGSVRGASETGLAAWLGWGEAGLATLAFVALVTHVRTSRAPAQTGSLSASNASSINSGPPRDRL